MAVDFDTFLEWAKDRFGAENIKLKSTPHGTEIMTHSFYAHRKNIDDNKFHLWMNPSGGKSKHPEKGSFRCWKTDAQGSLVNLVADWDCIPFDDAEELICGVPTLRALEQKVHEFFGSVDDTKQPVQTIIPAESRKIELPDWSFLISGMEPNNPWRQKAEQYLQDRKLPIDGLYVCTKDKEYGNRIIIPYRNWDDDITWFNARLISERKDVLRYMKCKAEGISQEDVLFMTEWPRSGTKVYIMEGELDALSMKQAGFVACAIGGKTISDVQMEMIRQYVPVLAFDTDDGKQDWGLQAMINVGNDLLERGFPYVGYVRPPRAYKDWNKLLVNRNVQTLHSYVTQFEKRYTEFTALQLRANRV